jgi:hypothetical protein
MDNCVGILAVERDAEDGVIVKFSDGTITGYVAEELLILRPFRESVTATRVIGSNSGSAGSATA